MHCLMLLSLRRWVCVLSGSVHGHIGELMLSKGARVASLVHPPAGLKHRRLRNVRSGMWALSLMVREDPPLAPSHDLR